MSEPLKTRGGNEIQPDRRRPWRRPTLQRLNSSDAGEGGPKTPPNPDGGNNQNNMMS